MNADSIKIECEEDGFWLEIDTDEPEPFDRLHLHITDPEALYDHVKAAIGPWLRECDDAHDNFLRGVTNDADGFPRVFACDPDERGGYDTSDPEHPDFHSIHADIWDSREGK